MHTVHQVSQFIPPPPSDIPNQYFPQVPLVVANFPTFGYFRLFLRKVTALKNSNFLYIISQLFLTPGKIPPPFSPLPFSFKIPCSSLRDVINLADSQQTGGTPYQQEARISGAILEMGFRPIKEQDRSVDDRSMWVVDRHVMGTNQKSKIGHVSKILQ